MLSGHFEEAPSLLRRQVPEELYQHPSCCGEEDGLLHPGHRSLLRLSFVTFMLFLIYFFYIMHLFGSI